MASMTASTEDLIHAGIDLINKIVTKKGMVQWPRIGPAISTKQGYYREAIVTALGDVGIVPAGAVIPTDTKLRLYTNDFYPLKFAKAYEYDYESEKFDHYGEIANISKDLSTVFRRHRNKEMANLLNNGFSSSYNIYDGQPLFSTAHVGAPGYTSTGWSNTAATSAALGSISLEEGMTNLYNQTDLRAELMEFEGNMILHVPNALIPLADRITRAKGLAQTNDNDPNYAGQYVKADKQSWLTASGPWFLKMANDEEHGLRMFNFSGYEIMKGADIRTAQKIVTALELYTTGVIQWQGVYGTGN